METVERVAETVLYEGYLLFPYRQSAMKNQQRWSFGGVYPRAYSEQSAGDDPWIMQTECIVTGDPRTRIEVKVRFLQIVDRKVAERVEGALSFVGELRTGDQVYRPWEEARERTIIAGGTGEDSLHLADLIGNPRIWMIDIPGGTEEESVTDSEGRETGALVRGWHAVCGQVSIEAKPIDTQKGCYRLTVRIFNMTLWTRPDEERESRLRADVLSQTFVSTHTILRVHDGSFVSLLEPSAEYKEAVEACENIKTWPVLVGEQGELHTLLSSPIILYDYPQVAPETPGDLFDATEIDELLRLSILTLTDDEKAQMRESDPRSREILEQTEALSAEQLMKLHGAIRSLEPVRREE